MTMENVQEAARLAAEAAQPGSDLRGPAEYKRKVVRALAARAIRAAADRAFAGGVAMSDEKQQVTLTINGQPVTAEIEPRLLLVHFIREVANLTGTHIGCDTTSCGACTVLVNGVPAKSCTMFAVQADGAQISTVEGLEQGGVLHPMQEGFFQEHGLQCGFCTPGMMMTAVAFLERNPNPDR